MIISLVSFNAELCDGIFMVRLKSSEDIERLAEGGHLLSMVLDELEKAAVQGISLRELNALAEKKIAQLKCRPAFLNYAPDGHNGFPAALCTSVNDIVVHGIPDDTLLREGDVVGLDLGLVYQRKYYLDSARTVIVGEGEPESRRLVKVTKEALRRGIEASQVGNRIGDIGAAIQEWVEQEGFGVVRQLVGHGVGYGVHEEPKVPNFGTSGRGMMLEEGLVIAIEPMVTIGDPSVETGDDGWGVRSVEGFATAHQEHTIALTSDGPRILTN